MIFKWIYKRPWRYSLVSVGLALMGLSLAWAAPTFLVFILSGAIMLGAYFFFLAAGEMHTHWLVYAPKTGTDVKYVQDLFR